MKNKKLVLFSGLLFSLVTFNASADDSTLDAAIGGGLGGALGAAIGNEVGGKEGAVLGGALGGAAGAAIATENDDNHHERDRDMHLHVKGGQGGFCPPGQAKKGNC